MKTLIFILGSIFICMAPHLAQAKSCHDAGLTARDEQVCRSYQKIYQLNEGQINECANPVFSEDERIDCMYSVSRRHLTAEQMTNCHPLYDYDKSSQIYCLVHTE